MAIDFHAVVSYDFHVISRFDKRSAARTVLMLLEMQGIETGSYPKIKTFGSIRSQYKPMLYYPKCIATTLFS